MAPPRRTAPSGPTRNVVPPSFAFTAADLLYEDEWLIAVHKPPGLPSQPTLDPARPNALGVLRDFLQKRDGGTPYLVLHHRLDRDTSGVLLFARQPGANAGVTALFASRALQKIYHALALAAATAPETWEVDNHLGVTGRVRKAERFGAVRSGGDHAQTSFTVLERFPGVVLVEARPHTGRTHQIRVHLAEGGYPILGDTLYGGPAEVRLPGGTVLAVPRVLLHAAALSFPHPLTGAAIEIRCPLPEDFSTLLNTLRRR